jgi:hypothetical protein
MTPASLYGMVLGIPTRAAAGGGVAELNVVAPTITPTYGSERLQNAGFETAGAGGADVFANWTEQVAGASSIADEGALVHGGSHAAKMTVDGSNSTCTLLQGVASATQWLEYGVYGRADSGTPAFQMGADPYNAFTLSATYALYEGSQIGGGANFLIARSSAANRILYMDDASVRFIDFASMHTLLGERPLLNGTYQCTPTVPVARQAGIVVGYADDNNYVLAYLDRFGGNRVQLVSCIGGTLTKKLGAVGVSVTYAAGAALAVMVNDTSFSVFYNGIQVGTTQTIATATLGLQVHAFASHATAEVGTVTTNPNFS